MAASRASLLLDAERRPAAVLLGLLPELRPRQGPLVVDELGPEGLHERAGADLAEADEPLGVPPGEELPGQRPQEILSEVPRGRTCPGPVPDQASVDAAVAAAVPPGEFAATASFPTPGLCCSLGFGLRQNPRPRATYDVNRRQPHSPRPLHLTWRQVMIAFSSHGAPTALSRHCG